MDLIVESVHMESRLSNKKLFFIETENSSESEIFFQKFQSNY